MGYNPVIAVQGQIANNLRGGLAELGNRPLEKAKLSLQEAQIMDRIRRGDASDVRADRSLELSEESGARATDLQAHNILMSLDANKRGNAADTRAVAQAGRNETVFEQQQKEYKRLEAEKDKPVYLPEMMQGFFGKPKLEGDADYGPGGVLGSSGGPSKETMMHVVSNGWMPEAFKMSGIKLGKKDATGQNPLVRADGSPVTHRDDEKIGLVMQAAVLSKFDPGHYWDQRARKINEAIKFDDIPDPSSEDLAWLEKYNKKKPQALIKAREKQIEDIKKMYAPLAEIGVKQFGLLDDGISRAEKKISELKGVLSARASHKNALELEAIKSAGKLVGSLEKDALFLSTSQGKTNGKLNLSVAEATNIIRYDKTMAQRQRGAAEELKLLDKDDYDAEPLAAKIAEIKKSWGVDPVSIKNSQKAAKAAKPGKDNDPDGIRETLFK